MNRATLLSPGPSWPSGDYAEIAILDISEEAVELKFSTRLAEGFEKGLGSWKSLGARLDEGEVVELIKYMARPGNGFILRMDKSCDAEQVLRKITQFLGCKDDCISWKNIAKTEKKIAQSIYQLTRLQIAVETGHILDPHRPQSRSCYSAEDCRPTDELKSIIYGAKIATSQRRSIPERLAVSRALLTHGIL